MTYEDYWKKYTRCPKCMHYIRDGNLFCRDCIHFHPYMDPKLSCDNFRATEECMQHMNRVIDGKKDVNLWDTL